MGAFCQTQDNANYFTISLFKKISESSFLFCPFFFPRNCAFNLPFSVGFLPLDKALGLLQGNTSLIIGRPFIGEGNGNPLQCSCLENPRDGGAWWAAVYGVTRSRTRLKQLSSSSGADLPGPLGGLNEMTRVVWCIHCEAECPTLPSLCSRNRHSNGLGKPVLWSLLTLQKCFHPSMTYW